MLAKKTMSSEDMGALWVRTKGDKEYMTGVVTIDNVAHQIVLFKNARKEKPNQPDWRIYKSTPKPAEDPKNDTPF